MIFRDTKEEHSVSVKCLYLEIGCRLTTKVSGFEMTSNCLFSKLWIWIDVNNLISDGQSDIWFYDTIISVMVPLNKINKMDYSNQNFVLSIAWRVFHKFSLLAYTFILYLSYKYSRRVDAQCIPKTRQPPQITWIGTVNSVNKTKKGPGHNPPNPHPNPKQKAPPMSFQSTFEFTESKTFEPSKLMPFFLIIVKVMKLTANPHPNTNNNAGFHCSLICKNYNMLILRLIPETINPTAKTTPTKKTINWSVIDLLLLISSSVVLLTANPIIGNINPTIKTQMADAVWL